MMNMVSFIAKTINGTKTVDLTLSAVSMTLSQQRVEP